MEYDTPSRFLRDIDPQLLKVEGGSAEVRAFMPRAEQPLPSRYGFSRPAQSQRPFQNPRSVQNPRPVATQFMADPKPRLMPLRREASTPQSAAIGNIGLREGSVIEHQRFGIGRVVRIEGTGENTKATVEFKNAGTRQLLLKFAKYTIV